MKRLLANDEAARIEALLEYKILDTRPEVAFDDITRLASYICGTPIALVSLVDTNRQWFKSKVGLDAIETPRDIAFCTHAIQQTDVFMIPDATLDERFVNNPLVTSSPHIRFYAGVPLINAEGYGLGTLCVIDDVPRKLSSKQVEALQILGRQVMNRLELRRNLDGLLLSTNQRQRKKKINQQFLIKLGGWVGLSSLIILMVGVFSYQNIKGFINIHHEQQKTLQQVYTQEKLILYFQELESFQRNYILTGNEIYLQDSLDAITKINQELQILKNLKSSQPIAQQQFFVNIESQILTKLSIIKESLDWRRKNKPEKALQIFVISQKHNIKKLDIYLHDLETQKKEIFQHQSTEILNNVNSTILTLVISISFCILIFLIVYYIIYREIVERKLTEASLQKERNFISTVLDTANALVIVLDSQGQIIRFNRACEETTGYSVDEVTNRCFWNLFIDPKDRPAVQAMFTEVRLNQGCKEYENYWLTKDGNHRLINWSNKIIWDDKNKIEFIISTGIDITERKQAEASLKQQLAAVEATTDGIGIVDENGNYIYLNSAHVNIFGYIDDTELLGTTWQQLYEQEQTEMV